MLSHTATYSNAQDFKNVDTFWDSGGKCRDSKQRRAGGREFQILVATTVIINFSDVSAASSKCLFQLGGHETE